MFFMYFKKNFGFKSFRKKLKQKTDFDIFYKKLQKQI